MTYADIQNKFRDKYDMYISTCEIADGKRTIGFNVKPSKNRINKKEVQKKCNAVKLSKLKSIVGRPK